jgi:CDP-glucose 4,6-dehydratase
MRSILYAQGYNFGPHSTDLLTVEDMTKLAVDIWGEGNFEFSQLSSQPHEAGLLSLDITKADKELNWQPKLNAREALYFTLQWYKTYYKNPVDIIDLTLQQIDNYWKNNNQQYDLG